VGLQKITHNGRCLQDAGKWLIGSSRSDSDLKSDTERDNELNNASELTTIDEEEGEGRMGESKVGLQNQGDVSRQLEKAAAEASISKASHLTECGSRQRSS
jgi:hypothetical protein